MKTSESTIYHDNGAVTISQTYEISFKPIKKPRIPRKLKKRFKKDHNKFWHGNPTKFYDHGTLWPQGIFLDADQIIVKLDSIGGMI